jgi:hypothetical protein
MVPPRNICKVGVYIGEKGESHGVRLARGDRQTGGHGMRRCSLCPLRVCMCVSNTYADNISKARTRTSKPQNQHFLRTGFLSDLNGHFFHVDTQCTSGISCPRSAAAGPPRRQPFVHCSLKRRRLSLVFRLSGFLLLHLLALFSVACCVLARAGQDWRPLVGRHWHLLVGSNDANGWIRYEETGECDQRSHRFLVVSPKKEGVRRTRPTANQRGRTERT